MKRNGFTLIELLAVILILGIIALIAVPTVTNVIDEAKRGAAKTSAAEYLKAVEQNYEMAILKNDLSKWNSLEKDENGCTTIAELNGLVEVKGTIPSSDTVVCLDRDKLVVSMEGVISKYEFKYADNQITIEDEVRRTEGNIVEPTRKYIVYNGKAQELVNPGSSDTGTIEYRLDGLEYSTEIPTAINAGSYTVYYKVIGDKDHYDIEEQSMEVTINKAPNTLTLSSNTGTVTYPNIGTFTITKNESNGILSCSSSDTNAATCSVSGNTVTVTPGQVASNNVNIVVHSGETDNYSEGQVTYVLISKSGLLSYTANDYSGTYDGESHSINVTSLGATIKYGTVEGTYNLTTNPSYINAGTYIVYYQVTKAGYATVTGSKTVTISKAKTATTGSCSNLIYNGSSRTLASGGSYVSYSNNSGTNAGNYTVTVKSNSNYLFSDGSSSKTLSCSIAKAAGSLTAPTTKILEYTGAAQSLVNAGSSSTGTIQYKLSGGSYSTSIPTATNIGTYTVYYKVVGNSNYNDVAEQSLSVSISTAVDHYEFGDPTTSSPTTYDSLGHNVFVKLNGAQKYLCFDSNSYMDCFINNIYGNDFGHISSTFSPSNCSYDVGQTTCNAFNIKCTFSSTFMACTDTKRNEGCLLLPNGQVTCQASAN